MRLDITITNLCDNVIIRWIEFLSFQESLLSIYLNKKFKHLKHSQVPEFSSMRSLIISDFQKSYFLK